MSDQPLIDVICRDQVRLIHSNVTWGTGFASPTERGLPTGNPFDWDAARMSYLNALTLQAPADREAALARTFETLGHVMHLVQDLAVPAHPRNDFNAHLAFSREKLFEDGFEQFVRRNPGMVDTAEPRQVDIVGRLVTRFWDTDQYTGANPSSDTTQGLAEYTNANFVSLDTILTEDLSPSDTYFFPYPRLRSTNADALFGKDASVARVVRGEDGRVDTGLYLDKVRDGETITNFLRAGYLTGDFIDKAPPGTPRRLVLQLDDEVHSNYAAKLVPMALGYSRGLLDYFFRGKLDVDLLVADAADDRVARLGGFNRSSDALDGGTLTLYADAPDGTRSETAALDQPLTVSADRDMPVTSARFKLAGEVERVVAVYTGKLGNEAPADAFPGAVIGKVLGGVRVEEVFTDGEQWTMRSPTGAFPLYDDAGALTTARIADLRWGDGPSQLVARLASLPGRLPQFAAYEVPRQADAVEPVTQVVAGAPVVQLATLRPVTAFPTTLPVVTAVALNHTINYRQQLVTSNRTLIRQWRPTVRETEGNDEINYQAVRVEYGPVTIQFANEQRMPFADTVSVVLDLAHHETSDVRDRPSYAWSVRDVGLTTGGHIVVVVRVSLTEPPFSLRPRLSQPVWGYDARGNKIVLETCSFFSGCQPEEFVLIRNYPLAIDPLLWAIVDVTEGTVLASTAAPSLTIDSSEAVEIPHWATEAQGPTPVVYVHDLEKREGGPRPQDLIGGWHQVSVRSWDGQPAVTTSDLTLAAGTSLAVAGWYRSVDLERALSDSGLLGLAPGFPGRITTRLAFGDFGSGQQILVVRLAATPPRELTPTLDLAVRARPAPGGERLVFLADGEVVGQHEVNAIVAWDAVGGRARVPLVQPLGFAETGLDLADATSRQALVHWSEFGRSYLVSLDGPAAVRVFEDPGALFRFRVLDPQYLYHVDVQRFFRLDPPLQSTPLPAKLTTLNPNPAFGDYHAIRLP